MARPSPAQQYYLSLIAVLRAFGVLFTLVSIFITASNLPVHMGSGDMKLVAIDLVGGAAGLLVGLGLYQIATKFQRRYRAYIENRTK